MDLRKLALAGFLTTSLPIASATDAPPTPPYADFVGSWVLCQDEDGSPKDTMQFFEEGYGFVIRQGKPKTPFLYLPNGNKVLLAVNSRGNMVTIYLDWPDSKDKLILVSERTGHQAFYVREQDQKKFECTAK